jgi:hypothetical protein
MPMTFTMAVKRRLKFLSGEWKIVEMPDLTEDYLLESKNPHFNLTFKGKRVDGHFQYGLCEGELDGEVVEKDGNSLEIRFSFEGLDEMDEGNGYGEAVFSEDNKTLTGKLHYHHADDHRFICRKKTRR